MITRCSSSLIIPPFLPSFLPSLLLHTTFFFFLQNSDLSGKFESRPGLPCRPTVFWAHAYSMSTSTVQHPPTSTPCQWTLHSYMPPSVEVAVKLFPKSSPGSSPQGALDGTVSLPANCGQKGTKDLLLCSGQVWEPNWTRCRFKLHPPPFSTERLDFYRKEYKMIPRCAPAAFR